jgi:acyl dehydratase
VSFPDQLRLTSAPVGAVQLALFAAASGDHNPLHLDPEVARQAGFERPVVHGMLTMALAGRLFTQHFGAGCVRSLQTRFSGVALVGDVIEFAATLQQIEDGVAHYALRGATARGSEVMTGTARVTRP